MLHCPSTSSLFSVRDTVSSVEVDTEESAYFKTLRRDDEDGESNGSGGFQSSDEYNDLVLRLLSVVESVVINGE